MNIWLLNHYANTPDFPGGTRHFDLASELVKMGHEVTIFASAFNQKLRRKVHLAESSMWGMEVIEDVRFVWLDTFPYYGNNWRRGVNMASYMLRVCHVGLKLPRILPDVSPPDVIIGSSVHLLAVVAAYFLARAFKAHFVMEVRDLWPQTLVDMGALTEGSLITRGLRWLERFLYKRAEQIIVLMPKPGEYITKIGGDAAKIQWIPNGVNLSRSSLDGVDFAESQSFVVMYVGAHGRANALEVLLDAAKIIQNRGYKDIKFKFIGDGPERQNLIDYSKRLDLYNSEFMGAIPKGEVPSALQTSDVLALVLQDLELYKYGISLNKLFDYLAASKPIILAGNPINNVVEDAQAGITVPPDAPEKLADAIIQLYHMSPDERKAMGIRGRKHVEKYYDTKVLAECLAEIMQELGPNERQKNTEDVQTTF